MSFMDCNKRIATGSKKCTPKKRELGLNLVKNIYGKRAQLVCKQYTEGAETCKAIGKLPHGVCLNKLY